MIRITINDDDDLTLFTLKLKLTCWVNTVEVEFRVIDFGLMIHLLYHRF